VPCDRAYARHSSGARRFRSATALPERHCVIFALVQERSAGWGKLEVKSNSVTHLSAAQIELATLVCIVSCRPVELVALTRAHCELVANGGIVTTASFGWAPSYSRGQSGARLRAARKGRCFTREMLWVQLAHDASDGLRQDSRANTCSCKYMQLLCTGAKSSKHEAREGIVSFGQSAHWRKHVAATNRR
jgi:hypothetical protein